jgi:N-hydroxyarylamine O-acetyltransferase
LLNVDTYLRRICYEGDLQPDLETLQRLHSLHVTHIPYENLDILQGMSYHLETSALFQKMIVEKRGGYCYELAGLFACLLEALGYTVSMVSARIHQTDGTIGEEFDHAVLIVSLERRWLVDVGNARWFHQPLCIDTEEPQIDAGRTYQIVAHEGGYRMLWESAEGEMVPQYQFALYPRQLTEFIPMCHYKWTSPQSRFTQGRFCSRVLGNERVTLQGTLLVRWRGWDKVERILESEEEVERVLEEYFNLTLHRTGSEFCRE